MKKIFIITLIASFGFLISCSNHKQRSSEKELSKVTFATSKNMWCGLGLIANEKGFFIEEGLDVDIKFLDAGRYCLDALVSNSSDFSTIVEVNTAYFGYTGNTSVINIASIVSSTSSGIIANRSSGIEKPEDLKGKKLALSPGTTSDIFANRFIAKYGISQNEIDIRKIQPLAMQGAMVSAELMQPQHGIPIFITLVRVLGENAIVFRDPEVYTGYMLVAVRKEWADENKETVFAFIKALKKAEQFARTNIGEAQQIVATTINLDLEIVKATWDDHKMILKLDKDELLNAVRSEGEWFHENMDGYKDKEVPDYSIFINDKYIKEALIK